MISWLSARRLKLEPGPWQVALEGVVGAIQDAIEAVLPEHAAESCCRLSASLWIFAGLRQFNWNYSRPAWLRRLTCRPRRPLGAPGFSFGALVWHSDSWSQDVSAPLHRAQPHIAAVSHRQRNLPHRRFGGASVRQHFQPGDGRAC